jgi:uncharacterized membrane protein YeaQ/YmgE (transglycosylase-associated protein family)
MSLLIYLILVAISGLLMGGLARLALPGRDPMSLFQTMLVGVAGAFVGGLITRALFGGAYGLPVAFACSFAIVYLIRRRRGGDLTSPDAATRARRQRRREV